MTEIKELIARINLNPSCLAQMDWREETDWFSKERIRQIIEGNTDDEVCEIACGFIVDAWYDACEGEKTRDWNTKGRYRGLCEQIDWDTWEYRFAPDRNQKAPTHCARIEDFIKEKFAVRRGKIRLIERLACVQQKADKDMELLASEGGELDFESISRFAAKTVMEEFKEADLEECSRHCQKIEEAKRQARMEAVRELVEQIIAYAENFPSNQNDKAEVVKEVLLGKLVGAHIPPQAMTTELKKRLFNLGRKEANVNVSAESLFKVTGNQEVNIGGGNNNGRQ